MAELKIIWMGGQVPIQTRYALPAGFYIAKAGIKVLTLRLKAGVVFKEEDDYTTLLLIDEEVPTLAVSTEAFPGVGQVHLIKYLRREEDGILVPADDSAEGLFVSEEDEEERARSVRVRAIDFGGRN